ncbi:hypothetical protein B0H13DRAFT_1880629 [Mycena leptocephala]|nr:hypothetical protein B0H13DRAFT_1880629 [Mycena leptocephala]
MALHKLSNESITAKLVETMDIIWRSQIVLTQLVEAIEIQWVTIVLTWLVEAMEIQWKKSLLAPGLVLGGNGGMAEKVQSMRAHGWKAAAEVDPTPAVREQRKDEIERLAAPQQRRGWVPSPPRSQSPA